MITFFDVFPQIYAKWNWFHLKFELKVNFSWIFKVIANAGGINTLACVEALKQACKKADVDLKIASVTGDDLMPMRKDLIQGQPIKISEMNTGQPLPKTVHSMTAYFGAGPIGKFRNFQNYVKSTRGEYCRICRFI